MLTIRLTSDMSAEDMAPLWPDIVACLERYVSRFPQDDTVENIIRKCAEGKRQLWIVQDGERVVLSAITEVRHIEATDRNRLAFVETGGERIQDAMPLIEDIERWGIEDRECAEADFIGRKGWEKLLRPYGYEPVATIYRKVLRDGQR